MNDKPKELKEHSAQIFELGCMERPVYLKEDVDAVIAELKQKLAEKESWVKMLGEGEAALSLELEKTKQKLEDAKATAYTESVDAGMENRRLKRALWMARANNARNSYLKWNLFANFESEDKLFTIDEYDETPGATDGQVLRTYTEWMRIWENIERKCRAKAEADK